MQDDRWLLPSRQSDVPGRDLIAPARLHGRREGTFLALASLFLIATLALPLWFASTWVIDLTGLPIDLAGATELSIGVLLFPLALIVGQLVTELYGARRAGMLVLAATVTSVAVIGGEALTIDGYPRALALTLVACTAVTNAINVLVFATARRAMDGRALALRSFVATPVALLAGWSAFTATWVAIGLELDDALALASTPCLYALACALVGALPLVIARRAVGAYLRIAGPLQDQVQPGRRRLPPALIVDDSQPFRRPSFNPYTTGELQFFAEGDELANTEA
ncbi:MAG: VUT family protein [Kofleriaceae bacterium]